MAAFLAVARSDSSKDLVEALRLHHEPPLTVVYADAEGEMGLQVAGFIPKREFSRGLVPLPGRARWYEWRGPIAFDELPQVRVKPGRDGRAKGWVIAADDRLLRNRAPSRIEWLWREMWKAHHYAGRGAPVSFALAVVDIALWDLKGRTLGEPLWRLLGGFQPEVRAYAGNIDLNFPVGQLLEGATRSLEAGFKSIKMRLGKPTLREDLERVRAMREHLPADIELMADANEAWRPDQAMQALHALQEFHLVWIEEQFPTPGSAGESPPGRASDVTLQRPRAQRFHPFQKPPLKWT